MAAWLAVKPRSHCCLPVFAGISRGGGRGRPAARAPRRACAMARRDGRLETATARARRSPRGQLELLGTARTRAIQVDVIEFPRASLALLDADPAWTRPTYRPPPTELHDAGGGIENASPRLARGHARRRATRSLAAGAAGIAKIEASAQLRQARPGPVTPIAGLNWRGRGDG